jgi:hypothetical protein
MDKVEIHSGRGEEEHGEHRGMPFLIRPLPGNDNDIEDDDKDGTGVWRWLRTEDQATEWLSLFYGTFNKAAVM